jgi:hypothetical protein
MPTLVIQQPKRSMVSKSGAFRSPSRARKRFGRVANVHAVCVSEKWRTRGNRMLDGPDSAEYPHGAQ